MRALGGPPEDTPVEKNLFADGSARHTWKLVHSRVSGGGVVITRYECAGAVESGAHEKKKPSALELARED